MIADLFFIFSMLLLLLRIARWETYATMWVVVDVLSALFFFMSFYFFALAAPVTITTNSTAYHVPTYQPSGTYNVVNTITNTIVSTPSAAITVNSNQFILLATVTFFYIIIMMIFAVRDFILRRESF